MKKLIPVASLSGLLFVIGFISISVRNDNTAFAAAPCKSCAKAADSGKKQSSSKKICSAITGILKNEIGKTKNKTKLDILKGGLDYANDVCDSGGSPDLAKITKGLPEKDKARISQKTNAALFDGVADRPDKDFSPSTSKTAATLTGTGGQITDLKSSEPNTPKFSQVTEFSLASAKTASATAVKASPDSCKPQAYIAICTCLPPNDSIKLGYSMCYDACADLIVNSGRCPAGGIGFKWLDNLIARGKKFLKDAATVITNPGELAKKLWKDVTEVVNYTKEKATDAKNWIEEKYHDLVFDETRCGTGWFNKDKQCCVKDKVFNKCGGRCMPPSEYAVFKNHDCEPGFKGYCKSYNVYFRDSRYLDLKGVYVGEDFRNHRFVDKRPACTPELPERTSFPLEKNPNGPFGFGDTLGISAELIITTPCAHQFDQVVMLGGCVIQTNTITFEADPSGARRIFRSDEPSIPKQ